MHKVYPLRDLLMAKEMCLKMSHNFLVKLRDVNKRKEKEKEKG